MPLFSDSPKTADKNRYSPDSSPAEQPQDAHEVELRDFSDDMDLDALGALLGSGDSFGAAEEKPQPDNQPKNKKMKKKKERKGSGSFFGAIADKLGGSKNKKKEQDELPSESEDISGFDFAYKPYTEADMAENHAADDGLTDFPFEQSSPFEAQSPFEQSSPFEANAPEGAVPPFDAPSAFSAGDGGVPETFSDDTNALSLEQSSEMPVSEGDKKRNDKKQLGLKDRLAALFAVISERFKGKKEKSSVPPVGEENGVNPQDDPNYISDTVSFVEMDDSYQGAPENQPPLLGNPLEENPIQPPPLDNPWEENPIQPPPVEMQMEEAANAEPLEVAAQAGNTAEALPPDRAEPSRTHNIMRAVRARIRQFGRRLPSFKPKVYTIPASTYDPIDDNIKSPSLMADVEEYIRQKSCLGPVELEYDEVRDYISAVNTEVRLSPEDIRPPENIREVRSAENELFDLIDQISAQNERQRRQIGVYAAPPEEDPYNYRGINDARQNYTDIEASSFSMQPRVSFESEQKIDPNRSAVEQEYYHRLRELEAQNQVFGEGFEDDFDDDLGGGSNPYRAAGLDDAFENDFDDSGFNSLGGQSFSDLRGGGLENDFDNDFDDDFENDFDDDFDDRRHVRSSPRGRKAQSNSFDDELAEDFDRNFASPRVAARPDERKSKRVAVRRRS